MTGISLIFLLLLFGGAAVVALIVSAITHNRAGLAILVGGGAVFLVLALLVLGFIGLAVVQPHVATVQTTAPAWAGGPMNDAARAAAQELQHFNEYSGVAPNQSWGISIKGLLLCVFLGGILVFILSRRLICPSAGHGFQRVRRVIAVGLLIGVVLLMGVRTQYTETRQRSIAAAAASQQAELEMAARQQILIANQSAHIQSQVAQQLAQADIHEQMDKFDAPRIPLPPQPTSPTLPAVPPGSASAPSAHLAAAKESVERTLVLLAQLMRDAAQETVAGASDSASADTTENPVPGDNKPNSPPKHKRTVKPVAGVDGKNKKADKAPGAGEIKTISTVAQSKPPEKLRGQPERPEDHQQASTAARAKPDQPAGARPAWIDEQPKRTGNTFREVVKTDEYESVDECNQAADIYLLLKTYQHMQQLAGRAYVDGALPSLNFSGGMISADGVVTTYGRGNSNWTDPRVRALSEMGIGIDYIRREIAKDEYIETTVRSVGPMKRLYTLIEFSPAVDRELGRHWAAHQRSERFAMAGIGAGSILSLLALAFALLKIDTWTKGYYTKRLFIGVPAAIIAGFFLLIKLAIIR